jgi:hypothetical protein
MTTSDTNKTGWHQDQSQPGCDSDDLFVVVGDKVFELAHIPASGNHLLGTLIDE